MRVIENINKPYRWVVLMAYFGVAAMSQMLWLNFAPLITFVQNKFSVDELTASSLLLSFPLLYVILSVHSGNLIDKKGYKYVISIGSIISAVFACVRIYDTSFYILLIGQTGIAIGQPYILNGISKMVSDWFNKEQSAMATGIGTAGMLIGMAVGMGLTPVFNESIGFQNTMIAFAIISIALTLLFMVFAKENDMIPSNTGSIIQKNAVKNLFENKNLIVLFIISFLAIGFFNGLTTWLEPILKSNNINAEEAGMVGAYLIIGGILGSILIPALSDKYRKRKPFLIACCIAALGLLYPLCTLTSLNTVYLLGGLMGFFFLPGYALMLSMCEELAGHDRAGAATGILMLAGNAGAVVVIILMPVIKGDMVLWTNAIYLMMALLVISLVCVISMLNESFQKSTIVKS